MKFKILLFITFLVSNNLSSQLEAGFALLEQADYQNAEIFFSNILEKDLNNKTANICYGRSVGLNGNAAKAITIFEEQVNLNPLDVEMLLNLGESYLWNKESEKAKDIYLTLLHIAPNNFGANFGMANTLSNLKEYEQATIFINKVQQLDPQNKQVLNSKKYILLGHSNYYRTQLEFELALNCVDQILEIEPLDPDALVTKADIFLSMGKEKNAISIFETLLQHELKPLQANLSLSYIHILLKKFKKAIAYAEQALSHSTPNTSDHLRASIQKVNALGAMKQFTQASDILLELEETYGYMDDIQMAKARMKVWARDYKQGLELYKSITNDDFELKMGKAELFSAIGDIKSASLLVNSALKEIPHQTDALNFKEKLNQSKKVVAEFHANRSRDTGFNEAEELKTNLIVPVGQTHRLFFHGENRLTRNVNQERSTNLTTIKIGDHWQPNYRVRINAGIGLFVYDDINLGKSKSLTGDFGIQYKVNRHNEIGYSYKRTFQNYSVDLTRQGIILNQHQLNYLYTNDNKPGFFVQFDKTFQSDQNERTLLFGSVYYEIKSFPLIKLGTNLSYMSFKDSRSELYFSPSKYQVYEAFIHVGNIYDVDAKWIYNLMFAYGNQKIENNRFQSVRRLEIELGFRINSSVSFKLNYINNTAANTTALGYRFNKLGAKASVIF